MTVSKRVTYPQILFENLLKCGGATHACDRCEGLNTETQNAADRVVSVSEQKGNIEFVKAQIFTFRDSFRIKLEIFLTQVSSFQ